MAIIISRSRMPEESAALDFAGAMDHKALVSLAVRWLNRLALLFFPNSQQPLAKPLMESDGSLGCPF